MSDWRGLGRGAQTGGPIQPFSSTNEMSLPNKNLQLKLTLGINIKSVNSLSVEPNSGLLAYISSGVVNLFETVKGGQVKYAQTVRKISCVNFSPNGKYLLIGETCHKPALAVWDIATEETVARFYCQTFGHTAAAFSPAMDVLISVGTVFDGTIYMWHWPGRYLLSTNRFKECIYNMSFSVNQSFFVTCGYHHLKFWYPKSKCDNPDESRILFGRPAILCDLKLNDFVDVACGSGESADLVYTVTKSGLLCKISEGRSVVLSKMFKNTEFTSVKAAGVEVVVGTQGGQVYIVDYRTLDVLANISHPVDVSIVQELMDRSEEGRMELMKKSLGATYIGFDPIHRRLTVIVSTCSLCIWDITDINAPRKVIFLRSHSDGVTSMEFVQDGSNNKNGVVLTVSQDCTLRLWAVRFTRTINCYESKTLHMHCNPEQCNPLAIKDDKLEKSNDSVLQSGSNTSLKKVNSQHSSADSSKCDSAIESVMATGKKRRGLTVVTTSADHHYIAFGDCLGVTYVCKMDAQAPIISIHEHSRGITALCFDATDREILISGSRDRRICVFNIGEELTFLTTLNLHSSTITHISSLPTPDGNMILSTGIDGCILLTKNIRDQFVVIGNKQVKSHVVSVCLDEKNNQVCLGSMNADVVICSLDSFKTIGKKFHACPQQHGVRLQCLHLNTQMNVLFSACSNYSINVLQYPTGFCLMSMPTPCSKITGLCLSKNMRYLISSTMDGCILFWRYRSMFFNRSRRSPYRLSSASDLGVGNKSIADNTSDASYSRQSGLPGSRRQRSFGRASSFPKSPDRLGSKLMETVNIPSSALFPVSIN